MYIRNIYFHFLYFSLRFHQFDWTPCKIDQYIVLHCSAQAISRRSSNLLVLDRENVLSHSESWTDQSSYSLQSFFLSFLINLPGDCQQCFWLQCRTHGYMSANICFPPTTACLYSLLLTTQSFQWKVETPTMYATYHFYCAMSWKAVEVLIEGDSRFYPE